MPCSDASCWALSSVRLETATTSTLSRVSRAGRWPYLAQPPTPMMPTRIFLLMGLLVLVRLVLWPGSGCAGSAGAGDHRRQEPGVELFQVVGAQQVHP